MNYYLRIFFITLIFFISSVAMCQNNGTTRHMSVFKSVTVQDTAIQNAMDSCIAILHECQFYKDSIESIVIVRPINEENGSVTQMEFNIAPKAWGDMEVTIDFCSSLKMPQPHSVKYKGTDFVFFIPTKGENLSEKNCYDTIYFPESTLFFLYVKKDSKQARYALSFPAKCTDIVQGYVYLSQNDDGEWVIKTKKCADVSHGNIILDDGTRRIYSIP